MAGSCFSYKGYWWFFRYCAGVQWKYSLNARSKVLLWEYPTNSGRSFSEISVLERY